LLILPVGELRFYSATGIAELVFILAQGNPDETLFMDIFPKFDYFFQMFGFSERHLIRACGVREPREVKDHQNVMMLAEKTAEKMCNGL
jgi:hypothetical protein